MANTSEALGNSTDTCTPGNHFEFWIVYYVIVSQCFILGTPAHLWCLWFYFYRTREKIKETQVFLLNHIVMEIIYCLECGIETLNVFTFSNYTLWSVLYFLFGVAWIGRALLQTCICVEQYLAVLHPVTFLRYKGIKYRIGAAAAAWMLACGYGVYEAFGMIFPDFIYTSVFIITMIVITFCCVSVLCALKHPGPGDTQSTKHTKKAVGNKQKRNAFNTIFSAFLLIVFTYLPQAIVIFIGGVDRFLFSCIILPSMASTNAFGVIITPLFKLHKEIKRIKKKDQNEIKVTP